MKGGPFEFNSATIWGTRNVIEACERHHVRQLVYVSSMSVLDQAGHQPGVPVNEASPYEPFPQQRGLYTKTKLEAEKMVLEAAAGNRIHAVVLRPGQIYGPGAEKTPPSGTIGIAGRWLVVGSGDHHVPLVYVENVVDALMLAAAKNLPNGSIFQLVDPEGLRQREYVDTARRAGLPVRASYVPAWFLKLAGFGVEMLGSPEAAGAADAVSGAVHHALVALRLHGGAYAIGLGAPRHYPRRHGPHFPGAGVAIERLRRHGKPREQSYRARSTFAAKYYF
jgi:nucleoside-diphosphate-sugar epimerase